MKTYALSILAAGASIVAAQADGNEPGNTSKDRLAIMDNALVNVTHSIESLDWTLGNYTGGDLATTAPVLLGASLSVQDAIKAAIASVDGVNPPIDIVGALFLKETVEHLGQVAENTVNTLFRQYQIFTDNMLKPIIESQLKDQAAGADNLTNAIKAKIPPEAGEIADQLAAPITDALQKGIEVFAANSTGPTGFIGAATAPTAGFGAAAIAALAAFAIVAF